MGRRKGRRIRREEEIETTTESKMLRKRRKGRKGVRRRVKPSFFSLTLLINQVDELDHALTFIPILRF
tara:strand:- start:7 stop:210 length:204 start_codon:yes stop_codon:yes gene_type:complete